MPQQQQPVQVLQANADGDDLEMFLLGEDEVKNNLVALKNMNSGEQVSISYEEVLKILKTK